VDWVVVPREVVGVYECAIEELRQTLCKGRLAAARPPVYEDEGRLLRWEQRPHAGGQPDVVQGLPRTCLGFL
jgi:hypothetical protein